MARELPKRSEVKEEYTWDVSAMYASKTAWEADLKEVDAIVSDLAKLEGSVMASAEKLLPLSAGYNSKENSVNA